MNETVQGRDYSAGSDFLKRLFGETLHNVELRACPNVKGAPGAASIRTRDAGDIERFCEKRDRDGIGIYFGVCTRGDGEKNDKHNVQECPALWVDIDCAKQGIAGADAISVLEFLPHPPSIIVNSGAGLHAYWVLEEPVVVAGAFEPIEQILRKLALVLAGDTQCAEIARIMRVPGTANDKPATRALNAGEPVICEVVSDTGRVHDIEALVEWVETQRPLLTGKHVVTERNVREDDPFVRYAREAGYEPALDIEAELAAMSQGDGERGIHPTQLRVSMSMIARGHEDEEIVELLLRETAKHEPRDGKPWNWGAEERAIRSMIRTGRARAIVRSDRASEPAKSAPRRTEGNLAVVHDLAEEKAKREKPEKKAKVEKGSTTVAVGEAVIGVWQDRHGPVMHTGGSTYAYEDGVWLEWDDRLAQRLRAIIQEACAKLGVEPKTAILGAAKAYFMDRPELIAHDVRWDVHGLVIAGDGVLDPKTGLVSGHNPDHFARYKVGALLEGSRSCAAWTRFLAETFSDKSREEAIALIATLQEWFGAMLVIDKPRAMRMGLLGHGASRTGKTQIAQVVRGILGARHVSGAKMRDLEGRFGMEPFLGRRGWIADDAIGEGEYLDADTYKVIVTGEPISVQCKGGRNVETTFGFPVMLTANNLPRVKDQSDAVYNRSLILPCTKVRDEKAPEPAGYNSISEKIIAEELTGVLWWAFEGWQRLSARGFYAPPATMLEARKGFEADNNPVATWMSECCEHDPSCKVSRADLLASMNGWWAQEYGADAKLWSGRGFIPRLTKGLSGYSPKTHDTTDDDGVRYLIGLRVNKVGLLAWSVHKNSRWGQDAKIASDEAFVNRDHGYASPAPDDRRPRF